MIDFWYTLDNIRSYNALFNFIILLRGVGKTYSFKKFGIDRAINHKEKFMYLRRTDVELKDAMDSFTRDVAREFPGYDFRIYRDKLQYNMPDLENEGQYLGAWETAGYFAYLSNARRKKSVSYEDVKYMAFDEFLVPVGDKYARYLPDEVTVFFDFYETVARMRDVQVFFLSNAMSTINPYFLFFKLRLPRTKSGICRISEEVVIEYHDSADYRKAKEETRFGKMVKGTRFESYAVANEFVDENYEFVKKKPGNAYYRFSLSVGESNFGVYKIPRSEEFYISNDYNPQCTVRYKYKNNSEGYRAFKTRRAIPQIERLVQAFERGSVWFDTLKVKTELLEFFERIM